MTGRSFARWLTAGLIAAQTGHAQLGPPDHAPALQWSDSGILSDTLGHDFAPYLAQLRQVTNTNWQARLPKEAVSGNLSGVVMIRFTILSSGKVKDGGMVLEGRSGQTPLDRAAWESISTAHYPPLPSDFTGAELIIRVRFRCNQTQEQANSTPLGKLPAAITIVFPSGP